jgi:putative redox protein
VNTVSCETDQASEYPAVIRVRDHVLRSDLKPSSGGTDTAPGPHDYFDAALASCQVATAMWYAKRHAIPLERVSCRVDSDDTDEAKGIYKMTLHVELVGALTDDQRASIMRAIEKCPIKKLMATSDVQIQYA